jgi:CheY-like chemotaxis protein
MAIQICLLVSDDLDDHQAISEALAEVSQNTVLLNVLNSQKALLLLKEPTYRPDYLMLDLSMHGIKVNSILNTVKGNNTEPKIPTIVFGYPDKFSQITDTEGLIFFNKDFGYSELHDFFRKMFA